MRLSRRSFLRLVGILPFVKFSLSTKPVLRPPGAVRDFLARCIRCGKCAEACPYDSIKLFDITAGANFGTPYIDPLDTPCYLCLKREPSGEDKPLSRYLLCTQACPTGALRKIKNDRETLKNLPDELKIGVSVLNRDLCLAWQYDSCGECYYNCPLRDDAMLDYPPNEQLPLGVGIRPYVNEKHCTGCGMCNYVCPVTEKIARVDLRKKEKLTYYEERYAPLVKNLIGRAGGKVELPAVRVRRVVK